MLRMLSIVAAVAFAATSASAAAFGIEMGTPISKLNVIRKVNDRQYVVTAPTPNSEFESYSVVATPTEGVCKVAAIGRDHNGDATGSSIRSTFEDMSAALTSKYGKGKKFDYLKAGALWKDYDEFAMALRREERALTTFWGMDIGSTLPSDIVGIQLQAKATSHSTTYLQLSYEFRNFDDCMADRRATDASAL